MTPTPERASFKSLISCTKSNTLSAHKDSPVSETVLFSFLGDQLVFVSQMKTEKEIVWVTMPHNGSVFRLLSLVLRQQVFFSLFLRRTKYWSTVLIFLLELKDICILFYILGQYLSHEISCTTKSRRRIFFYLGKETKKSPMSLSKERIELYSVDEVCSYRTIKTELIMGMSNLNKFLQIL